MKKVLILMSTYNGGDKIKKQIETIIKQREVITYINIRDDGSNDSTLKILKEVEKEYSNRISIVYGTNMGWKRSFLTLVNASENSYDYYGFSDQDDIWKEDKVITLINLMEDDKNYSGIKMAHCNSVSVDEKFNVRYEQEFRREKPVNIKNAIAMEYFQGCGMLWNKECMKLLRNSKVSNNNISHDYWVGLISYFFGKIYFCSEPKFYHIRYENSESYDGDIKKGRMKRLLSFFKNDSIYMNPAKDMLDNFESILKKETIIFLNKIIGYKKNIKYKIDLIFDKDFCRNSFLSTCYFKFLILLNKY